MKAWLKWKYILPFTIVICIIGAVIFIYRKYEPSRHFEQAQIPVLARPAVPSSPVPDSPGQAGLPQALMTEGGKQGQNEQKEDEGAAFNVLILGTDARGDEFSRTDTIFVVHVNPSQKQVKLVSIPRDTRVMIPGIGYTKVNHAHIIGELSGGNQAGTQSILQVTSDFLQVPINYYVKTNFEGFERFIDSIGGIDVELEDDIRLTYSNTVIAAGKQHLDGDTALKLARERKSLDDGDFGRQKNQALILKALARQLLKATSLQQLPRLIADFKEDVIDTNFTDNDLISLAWMMVDLSNENIEYASIPGHSAMLPDPLVGSQLYYWIPDTEEVKSITQMWLE